MRGFYTTVSYFWYLFTVNEIKTNLSLCGVGCCVFNSKSKVNLWSKYKVYSSPLLHKNCYRLNGVDVRVWW